MADNEGYKQKRKPVMGRRNDVPKPQTTPGKISKGRWAWCRLFFGQFVIWADYFEKDGAETDEVRDIKILYPIPNRPPVSWNLTACTEDELVAMKELFDTAFKWALPIVQERDQEAKDAFENGDDSHSRIYRAVPLVVYRSGPERKHSERVLDGSEDDAELLSDSDDSDRELRDEGPELVEQDTPGVQPQDNWPTPNQPSKLR